jgi:hypothetical protein
LTARSPAPRHRWLKFAALILVVAGLGLPVNDLFRYALLVIATVLVVMGDISVRWRRWLGATAAVGLCTLGQIWLAAPRIEEGHNVFIVDGAGGALAAGLPAAAFAFMRGEFDAKYPPAQRCDPARAGCWRGEGFPATAFAFSADGIYERPTYSRRVTGIDFADPVWLRLGFINEKSYNWYDSTDVERAVRDHRSLALLHRWTIALPWFVMYRFPADFVGSDLCWQGEVLWEGDGGHFEAVPHPSMQCRMLGGPDVGRRIFGVAIKHDLAMRLDPTAMLRLRQLIAPALALITTAAVLALLVSFRLSRVALPFALIAVTLVMVFVNDASFIGGVRPFDGGDDGIMYDGFARIMLRDLLAGDFAGALEGGEPVFYFTPGLRYLRVVEHFIFGESYLGYLSLILLLPFLVFATFRRFLPLTWALALVTIFAALPVGVLFGSSLVQYVKWASKGFADPAAYAFFLAGFLLLIGRCARGPGRRFGAAFLAGALFALALFVRPNLAPAAGILLAGAGLAALWQSQIQRIAGLCLGFLPVLGMALHNWVYGGVLAPFTSTTRLAMSMPPSAYLAAFGELSHFDPTGGHVTRALAQIAGWLAGPSESTIMAPLNAVAIIVVARVVVCGGADPWLRLTAAATLVQQGVGLFFLTYGRYYYLTWLLTLLVVAAWLHGEGLDLVRRRWPKLSDRIANHPASAAIARGLTRMSGMMAPTL